MDASKKSETETASPVDQFSTFIRGLKLPGVDVNEVLASQKKNIESLTKTMQTATEGAGAVARRQAEILRTALDQTTAMIRELTVPGSPKETVAKQAEFIKKAFETAVANARELAEMVEKSSKEAFEVVRRRTSESLDEIRKSVLKNKADWANGESPCREVAPPSRYRIHRQRPAGGGRTAVAVGRAAAVAACARCARARASTTIGFIAVRSPDRKSKSGGGIGDVAM